MSLPLVVLLSGVTALAARPVFASFKPAAPDGLAAPSNSARLGDTHLGPVTFFDPTYARDLITMSDRPAPGSR